MRGNKQQLSRERRIQESIGMVRIILESSIPRECKIGKPCGNTCISKDMECGEGESRGGAGGGQDYGPTSSELEAYSRVGRVRPLTHDPTFMFPGLSYFNRVFKLNLRPKDIADLAGCRGIRALTEPVVIDPDDLAINPNSSLAIEVRSNVTNSFGWTRAITSSGGEVELYNSTFLPKEGAKLEQGAGAKMLHQQAIACQRVGIKRIVTHAAGNIWSPSFTGYFVWPTLGYDGTIPQRLESSRPDSDIGAALRSLGRLYPDLRKQLSAGTLRVSSIINADYVDLQEEDKKLMQIMINKNTDWMARFKRSEKRSIASAKATIARLKEMLRRGKINGSQFWSIYGFGMKLTFDPSPGSPSMKQLEKILTRNMIREQKHESLSLEARLDRLIEKLTPDMNDEPPTSGGDQLEVIDSDYFFEVLTK